MSARYLVSHNAGEILRGNQMKTAATSVIEEREYRSGDIVEPGCYLDIETGSIVQVREADELPTGNRTIQYRRRFRRVPPESHAAPARRIVREK